MPITTSSEESQMYQDGVLRGLLESKYGLDGLELTTPVIYFVGMTLWKD
ncbi:MAG: hypothetical protein HQK89_16890 [Nitrospirae bacterium]|nr:hypothetical protein [Nitrospirota bacterium]